MSVTRKGKFHVDSHEVSSSDKILRTWRICRIRSMSRKAQLAVWQIAMIVINLSQWQVNQTFWQIATISGNAFQKLVKGSTRPKPCSINP